MRDTLITAAVCCDVDNKILYAVFGSVIKRPRKISYYGVLKVVKAEQRSLTFGIEKCFMLIPFLDKRCTLELFRSCLFDQSDLIIAAHLPFYHFGSLVREHHFCQEICNHFAFIIFTIEFHIGEHTCTQHRMSAVIKSI